MTQHLCGMGFSLLSLESPSCFFFVKTVPLRAIKIHTKLWQSPRPSTIAKPSNDAVQEEKAKPVDPFSLHSQRDLSHIFMMPSNADSPSDSCAPAALEKKQKTPASKRVCNWESMCQQAHKAFEDSAPGRCP